MRPRHPITIINFNVKRNIIVWINNKFLIWTQYLNMKRWFKNKIYLIYCLNKGFQLVIETKSFSLLHKLLVNNKNSRNNFIIQLLT